MQATPVSQFGALQVNIIYFLHITPTHWIVGNMYNNTFIRDQRSIYTAGEHKHIWVSRNSLSRIVPGQKYLLIFLSLFCHDFCSFIRSISKCGSDVIFMEFDSPTLRFRTKNITGSLRFRGDESSAQYSVYLFRTLVMVVLEN